MRCHPSDWRTHIFQDGYRTTNQKRFDEFNDFISYVWMIIPWFLDMCFTVVNMEGREPHRIDGIKDWVAMDPWFGNF